MEIQVSLLRTGTLQVWSFLRLLLSSLNGRDEFLKISRQVIVWVCSIRLRVGGNVERLDVIFCDYLRDERRWR